MTTTAILGLGNMGKGLAKRLAGKTQLVLGASNPAAAAEFATSVGASVTDYKNAVLAADIVVLALPYGAALELAGKLPLSGKIVVDISNPVKADFSGLAIGHTTSAAEELQAAAPSAKVVKGYNTIFASLFDTPVSATQNVPVFLAGNDAAAVDAVAELVTASGFAVEKVGGLDGARLVEPVGMLNIRFGYGLGQGTAIAPTWLKLAA
ncbi:MAG: oxidoreductase [Hyphomicrobiales bacterium]|jgi:predicted dinucleotide-binding enzyme|nr:MAG: oxidoreductase [Hyphomicrobiales bacterium]